MSKAHPPLVCAFSISSLAFLSYPLPSEIDSNFLLILISSANLRKSATGSEPADKIKINGVVTEESLNDFCKLNVGGIMNSLPSFSTI